MAREWPERHATVTESDGRRQCEQLDLKVNRLRRTVASLRRRASVLAQKLITIQEKHIASQEKYIEAQDEIMRLSLENEQLRSLRMELEGVRDPSV